MGTDLIGPFTAEEWCSFRQTGDDTDLLQCCAETSEIRDHLFAWLRMGGDQTWGRIMMRHALVPIQSHELEDEPLIKRMLVFLGWTDTATQDLIIEETEKWERDDQENG